MRERLRDVGRWLRDLLVVLIAYFSTSPEMTWWGHFVQGLVFGAVGSSLGLLADGTGGAGIVFNVGWFAQREVDNIILPLTEHGWSAAWQSLKDDGLLDFFMPYLGATASTLFVLLLIG